MANAIEAFLMEQSNVLFRKRYENYFLRELRTVEKHLACPIVPLTAEQKKEIIDYYASFGFDNIRTDWHEYIQSVSGRYSPKMVPDYFYHNVLERIYNDKRMQGWEDKATMHLFLPDVSFPETLVVNMHGYYCDADRNIISLDQVLNIIKDEGMLFAKPSRASGGGRNAAIITPENAVDILKKLEKNFVLQRVIRQSDELAVFNPSSVNTEKMLSFLYKGEVFILASFLRVGAPDSIVDNASGGKGFTIGIQEDGSLEPIGLNIRGEKRTNDYSGNSLVNRRLSHHREICDIIRKAHVKLPYFGFVSWDFCVTDKDEPLLIEYNVSNAEIMVNQSASGPLLGDMLDDVLADARKYSSDIKYFR